MTDEPTVMWPVFEAWACMTDEVLIHAVPPLRVEDRRSSCGLIPSRACAVQQTDDPPVVAVLPWPPYAAGGNGLRRCRECWDRTGKPRPHRDWHGITREGAV